MHNFDNQTILVTGGSSGIGLACAQRLARAGAKLVLNGRNVAALEAAKHQFEGDDHIVAAFDLEQVDDINEWLKQVRQQTGHIDHFVHCAGVQISKPIRMFNQKHFDHVMHVNLASAMAISKGFRFKRDKSKPGAIVFVSSIGGFIGQPGNVVYGASKAGLMSLTRGLAMEFLQDNIRVNCVAPALVDTPMSQRTQKQMTAKQYQKLIERHPMGVGQPDDVACGVVFLLSQEAKWINGVTLPIDGGHSVA
jgi:NAD(P)-dependent dehydrogenase (short-subunit alcohol dehydrogenase family)